MEKKQRKFSLALPPLDQLKFLIRKRKRKIMEIEELDGEGQYSKLITLL